MRARIRFLPSACGKTLSCKCKNAANKRLGKADSHQKHLRCAQTATHNLTTNKIPSGGGSQRGGSVNARTARWRHNPGRLASF